MKYNKLKDKNLAVTGIVTAIIVGTIAYFLLNPSLPKAPEEGEEIIPAVEHVTEKSGRMREVLHDNRMMMYVNSYSVASAIDAPPTEESMGNMFLTVDLTIMNMGDHILTLSPNFFKLKTGAGEIIASIYTSSIDAGLRSIYLPGSLSVRTFIVFAAPSFGDTPPILKYFDETSAFSVTLLRSESPQSPLPSEPKITGKTGELIDDGAVQLLANTEIISAVNKYTPKQNNIFVQISMNFKNVGKSTIRIDPLYAFMLDDKSYLYGVHESTTKLSSPLTMVDLEPSSSITGDVVIELPKDSTNLIFMYAGPNNSFFARIS